MRTLTHEEISQVSGAGGGGDTQSFGILNIALLNGNSLEVGDVLSGLLNGNKIGSGNELNTLVSDLIHIL